MGYGYTQIMGLTELAHGQIYIESETHSLRNIYAYFGEKIIAENYCVQHFIDVFLLYGSLILV